MNVQTNYLTNYQNYYMFDELVRTGTMYIKTSDIDIGNYQDWYTGLMNVLRDGIELSAVQQMKVTVDFGNDEVIKLSIFDSYYNIIIHL